MLGFLVASLAFVRASAAASLVDLLPEDTLAFVAAPNVSTLREIVTNGVQTAYWRDPAMAAFRDHFVASVQREFQHPLEKLLGMELSGFSDVATGPLTLALVQDGWTGTTNTAPALVVLADVGDATNRLAKRLRFLTKDWSDHERPFTTNVVRDTPFYGWSSTGPAIGNPFGIGMADGTNSTEIRWNLGQSGSLLLLSTSTNALENILQRQASADPGPVPRNLHFQSACTNLFADAQLYAWVDPVRLLPPLLKIASAQDTPINPTTIARFLGLTSLWSLSFALHCVGSGTAIDFAFDAPVAERAGLVKFAMIAPGESAPTDLVPQTVLTASRFRIDLKNALTSLEKFVVDAEPAASGAIQLILETAGKDEDPDYSLRGQILDNLGDDIVVFQPLPSTNSVDALLFPPKVVLIGSPAPGRLANAARVIANTLSPEPGSVTNRTFEGTRIYHLRSTDGEEEGGGMSFAPVLGYVAFCSDETVLERLIKVPATNAPALKTLQGLNEAAAKVGGLNTGWFSYENRRELLRLQLEGVRRMGDGPIDVTVAGRLWSLLSGSAADKPPIFDFKLHPPFETVAGHLGFSVAAGQITDEGFRFRVFVP